MPRVGPTKYSDMTRDTVIMMSTEETTHKGMKPKGQAISTWEEHPHFYIFFYFVKFSLELPQKLLN